MRKRSIEGIHIAVIIVLVILFVESLIYDMTLSDRMDRVSAENEDLKDELNAMDMDYSNLMNVTYSGNVSLSIVYKAVSPSVVKIECLIEQTTPFGSGVSVVQGSGFLAEYHDNTVIMTNNHVIEGADEISVTFRDGRAFEASVAGSDPYSDLAVLTAEIPDDLDNPLYISSSAEVDVGDPVFAVGTPYGLQGTLTSGIVSQTGRSIQETTTGYPIANIIQTSTPINPGNSGGPLFDYSGRVIGITTAIVEESEGLGFAVPSDTILKEMGNLIEDGTYVKHSWMGIQGTEMDYWIAQEIGSETTSGWLVGSVTGGGPAQESGVKGGNRNVQISGEVVRVGGDIIVSIEDASIVDGDTLFSYLEANTLPGDTVTLHVLRSDSYLDIDVVLGVRS